MARYVVPDELDNFSLLDIQRKYGGLEGIYSQFFGDFPKDQRLKAGQILTYTPVTGMEFDTSTEGKVIKQLFGVGPSPSEEAADKLMEASEKERQAEQKLAEDLFGPDNPFVFDEYAAKQVSETQYEPYYSEMMQDYLENIGIKRESVTGERDVLQALRTTPKGTAGETTRAYERAVTQANEGFAGRGLFFSGVKKRNLGQAEVEREEGLEQQGTSVLNKQRDVFGPGRAYETAVEGGIETQRGEQLKQYYTPRIQQYARRFPSEGNVLAGYVPPEFLRY